MGSLSVLHFMILFAVLGSPIALVVFLIRRNASAPAAPLGAEQAGAVPKHNRIVAALFAILLGAIGIHKFYLGRVGWGVLYLLFCWTIIPGVAGLVEGIIYLTMSDAAFAAKYG